MISYDPLWRELIVLKLSKTQMAVKAGISKNTHAKLGKSQFPGYFEEMWQNYRNSYDIGKAGVEKSRDGFSKLKEGVEKFCEGYSDQPFRKRLTEVFISVIDKQLESEEEPSEDQTDE